MRDILTDFLLYWSQPGSRVEPTTGQGYLLKFWHIFLKDAPLLKY